jgi:hypothetical protein
VLLPDPVIHLYWAYALARVEEMFEETPFPTGVCGAQTEREYVTLDPKKSPARFVGSEPRRGARASRRDEPQPLRAPPVLAAGPGHREPGNYQWYLFGFSFEIRHWTSPTCRLRLRKFS